MTNFLKRLIVRIRRIGKSAGFGIQSPTDFWFVNNIINESLPYYAYAELDKTAQDWQTRKLGRLFLRMANWRQPLTMPDSKYNEWCKAGCRKTTFCNMPESIDMAVVDIEDRERTEQIVARCNDNSVVAVENICKNKTLWKDLCNSKEATITFDLYYCGILMFDKKRYKHNYTVNF